APQRLALANSPTEAADVPTAARAWSSQRNSATTDREHGAEQPHDRPMPQRESGLEPERRTHRSSLLTRPDAGLAVVHLRTRRGRGVSPGVTQLSTTRTRHRRSGP